MKEWQWRGRTKKIFGDVSKTPVVQPVGRMQIKREYAQRVARDVADTTVEDRVTVEKRQRTGRRMAYGRSETRMRVDGTDDRPVRRA